MKIVIDISGDIYKRLLPYKDVPIISNHSNFLPELTHAVANGVPLPKEHGRLIDADSMWNAYHDLDYDFYEALDSVDTILESDKEDS